MTRSTYFNKAIFLTVFLALGCTGSGTMGCSGDSSGPTLDSALGGVYEISRYQASPVDPDTQEPVPNACEMIEDTAPIGPFLVMYGFLPNDDMDEAVLGGVFCSDVQSCRQVASQRPEPQFGYSFTQGSDENGWTGFGSGRLGRENDQCLVEIQTHTLTAVGESIQIDTESVDVIFDPDETMGQEVTCSLAKAVQTLASSTDLPCRSKFLLEARRTANL